MVEPPEPLDVNVATLGVIFVYPIQSLPRQATVDWDLFSPKIQSIPAVATDEAGGLSTTLTPDSPQLVWTNYLTNPTVPKLLSVSEPEPSRFSLPVVSCAGFTVAVLIALYILGSGRPRLLLGWPGAISAAAGVVAMVTFSQFRVSLPNPISSSAQIQQEQVEPLLHALLYNVYRSFDHRDDELIYDRLSASIAGDLLDDVYLQVRRSTELASQGGARIKIDEVELLEISEAEEANLEGKSFQCRWNASGSVGHWGHTHRRTNQYDAILTIGAIEGSWKITGIDLQQEQRVQLGGAS